LVWQKAFAAIIAAASKLPPSLQAHSKNLSRKELPAEVDRLDSLVRKPNVQQACARYKIKPAVRDELINLQLILSSQCLWTLCHEWYSPRWWRICYENWPEIATASITSSEDTEQQLTPDRWQANDSRG